MKVYIGTPIRRFDCVEPHRDVLKWARGMSAKHEVEYGLSCTYGVDSARSQLIEDAKAWGAERMLMIDSDVVPRTPWAEVFSYASQAFSRGYAAVLSPTLSSSNQILVWAPEGDRPYGSPLDIPTNAIFPISWGGLGFVVIDGAVLPRLKVLREQRFVNGPPAKLYCVYESGGDGEDLSLCRNIRQSTGLKIGGDCRIKTGHQKLSERPSWSEEVKDAVRGPS